MKDKLIERVVPKGRITTYVSYDGKVQGANQTNAMGMRHAFSSSSSSGKIPKPLVPQNHSYSKSNSTGFNYQEGARALGDYSIAYFTGAMSNLRSDPLPADLFLTNFGSPGYANLYNDTLEKLNRKVRENLDLSINAFEYRKTAEMLKLLTKDGLLRKSEELARRLGAPKDWRKYQSIPAEFWLQYQYGLHPLMLDTHGAWSELVGRSYSASRRVFKARTTNPISAERPFQPAADSEHGKPKRSVYEIAKGSHEGMEIGVRFNPSGTLPELARWTSLNPVSIAYELTPFSFVADWFVDVGMFLRETETAMLAQWTFKDGYRSHLRAASGEVHREYVNTLTGHGWFTGRVKAPFELVMFDRARLNSYPFPRVPRFRPQLGASRLLSAAALISSVVLPLGGPAVIRKGKRWNRDQRIYDPLYFN